jgi:predicted acylesterase/phospholipase RssA
MSIKNLVFSGAEVRGISYIGVIKAIEELDIAKSIETILGVSSGAIFALTMALGLTSRQLEQIILSISIEHIIKFDTTAIFNITNTYGIDDGNKLTRIFKILFKKILNNENATFQDLHNHNPDIKLIVLGTNLSKNTSEFFSIEHTPDMPLHTAIRISISIPICYNAVNYNNSVYIDGAFSNNFPINYFKDDMEHTLGIVITESDTIRNINTIGHYMYRVSECVMGIMTNHLKQVYNDHIIEIIVDYSVLEMTFDSDIKYRLIRSGYNEFKTKYISRYGESVSNHKTDTLSNNNDVVDMIQSLNDEINSHE